MRLRTQQFGPIGIEVSRDTLRVMQLRYGEGHGRQATPAVHAAALQRIDPDEPADAVRHRLVEILRQHRFQGRVAVTCLSPQDVTVKNLRLPSMPAAEMAGAVEYEARERFSLPEKEWAVRYISAGALPGEKSNQEEVIVLAARSTAIDTRLALLTRAGLNVAAIEPPANAFFRPFERFLQRSSDAETSNVLVDIGDICTQIVITRGPNIVFLKVCPIGADIFDREVAKALSLPVSEAAKLREQRLGDEAAGETEPSADEIINALETPLTQLGKEIALCLRYYAVTLRGQRPDVIHCGGSEARHVRLLKKLEAISEMPVRTDAAASDIEAMAVTAASGNERESCVWTTALGLALSEARLHDRAKVA